MCEDNEAFEVYFTFATRPDETTASGFRNVATLWVAVGKVLYFVFVADQTQLSHYKNLLIVCKHFHYATTGIFARPFQ